MTSIRLWLAGTVIFVGLGRLAGTVTSADEAVHSAARQSLSSDNYLCVSFPGRDRNCVSEKMSLVLLTHKTEYSPTEQITILKNSCRVLDIFVVVVALLIRA